MRAGSSAGSSGIGGNGVMGIVRSSHSSGESPFPPMVSGSALGLLGTDVEADALGEWQLGAVVDRAGLAAHVGLPGIRAGLAAATGRLFAAERAADLRTGGPHVHVRDAAVGPNSGEPLLSRTQTCG